jgi:tripartite-type tricarboxylate transporter receptor subunit TctC
MTTTRRHFLAATGSLALAAFALPDARAQALPDTARILAGFAPGGTVDVTSRRVADKLRDQVAKTVVVEIRSGAGGQIALSALKTAPADGLTLIVTPMSMLSAAVRKALAAPDLVDALALMGLEAKSSTPAELGGLLKKDSERWAPLIKTIGFTADS